jgi:Flp pilus assembly protein TadD
MYLLQARRLLRWSVLVLSLLVGLTAFAKDLHLTLPKRTKPTPVQKLNQDGVRAVEKHDYDRARRLFYKAYLLDPNDPFTLNNLGYMAEIDGELERAQRYYALAAELPSDAVIYRASRPGAEGKEVAEVAGNAGEKGMEVNRINVSAMGLLLKDRAPEADLQLQKALALDPKNPFTLNNLAWAKEKEGELEEAFSLYSRAAASGSREPVVVTVNNRWRGKPISEVAAENAEKVRKAMTRGDDVTTKVARLNLRGVSAVNRNDRRLARTYFEQAYKLDPNNAFTLNNMGYIAELDGDRETADFFYAKAQEANRSDARVAMATRREMEGQRMGAVADSNDQAVFNAQQAALAEKRQQGGPVVLRRRDNSPVIDPDRPPPPIANSAVAPSPGSSAGGVTGTANQPVQEVIPPLPDNQQPPAAGQPPTQPPPQNPPGANSPVQDVIPPLPDNQQPPGTQPPPSTPR